MLIANVAIVVVALLHIAFLILEMFFWTRPLGRKVFGLPREVAEASAPLAANQGLYNGFLAAGLLWSLIATEGAFQLKVFFLLCVLVAGIFGAATAKRSILFVQALPAAIALALLWMSR
jgi:putative membrane protein